MIDRFPEGGDDNSNFIFVRKERTEGNKLLGREKLATTLLERAGRDKETDVQTALMASAFDTRVFGAVFSVKKAAFNQCGPVQFGWAHQVRLIGMSDRGAQHLNTVVCVLARRSSRRCDKPVQQTRFVLNKDSKQSDRKAQPW